MQRAHALQVDGDGVAPGGDATDDAAACAEGDEPDAVGARVADEGREVVAAGGPHDGARTRRAVEAASGREKLPGPQVVGVGASVGAIGGDGVVAEARAEVVDEWVSHRGFAGFGRVVHCPPDRKPRRPWPREVDRGV
ncbi:MAG: hypothetical protein IPN17_38510 [Deltaproteobacteria bacterium]|nr:hypothetical protein [Deltaproteobacteria bacterium]